MKKFVYLTITLCLTVSLMACSSTGDNSSSSSASSSVSQVETSMIEAGRNLDVEIVRVTGTGVNIRSGANTSSSILGQASVNEYFEFISTQDDWNKITYNGNTAYISAEYSTVVTCTQTEADAYLGVESSDESADENIDDETDDEESSSTVSNTEDGEA